MRLPLKSLMAGRSPGALSRLLCADVKLFVRVHVSHTSLHRAAAGAELFLQRSFPVITHCGWKRGPLKLKGCEVPHLQSERTPHCASVPVSGYMDVMCLTTEDIFLPDRASLYVVCGVWCVCACYFECVYVCGGKWVRTMRAHVNPLGCVTSSFSKQVCR